VQKRGGRLAAGLRRSAAPFAFASPKPPRAEERSIFPNLFFFFGVLGNSVKPGARGGGLQKRCLGGMTGAWTLDFSVSSSLVL